MYELYKALFLIWAGPIPKYPISDPNPIPQPSLSSPFLSLESCREMENVYSWVRRSLSRPIKIKSFSKNESTHQSIVQDNDEIYGVNDKLIDLINAFTLDTFRNFPLQGFAYLYIHTIYTYIHICFLLCLRVFTCVNLQLSMIV